MRVAAIFVAACAVILTVYILEHTALGVSWNGDVTLRDDPETFFKAVVETTVIELALSLFVIFSIIATLFAFSFQRRLDQRIEDASEKVTQRAERITRNSFQAVSANIFHEMAYKAYYEVEEKVLQCWYFGSECMRMEDYGAAKELVQLGVHYSRRGLEHMEFYHPSENETDRLKRVPGHLNNSFLWHSAAEIILLGMRRPASYYEEHLSKIDELLNYVTSLDTPSRPFWYQAYESCAFFLVSLGSATQNEDHLQRGMDLLRTAVCGDVPRYGMEPPPQSWTQEVVWQYKRAGYIL